MFGCWQIKKKTMCLVLSSMTHYFNFQESAKLCGKLENNTLTEKRVGNVIIPVARETVLSASKNDQPNRLCD